MKGAESSRGLEQLSGGLLLKSLCMYIKLGSQGEPGAYVGDVYLLTKLSLRISRNLHSGKVSCIWPAGPHQPLLLKVHKNTLAPPPPTITRMSLFEPLQ